MPSIGQHIIRRQVLDVEVSGTEASGFALQRRLPELCHGWLTPALEPVLERAVPAHEHLTIDRLEIDAGLLSLENLERDLVEAVTQSLEKLLRERVRAAGAMGSFSATQRRTEAQSVQEAFLHFLKTGSLPWWFHLPAGKTLEDVVQASWHAAGRIGELPEHVSRSTIEVMTSSFVRKRLVQQFSAFFLTSLLAGLSKEAAAAISEVFAKLGTRDFAAEALRRFSEQSWQTVFALLAAGRRPTASALMTEYLNSLPEAERQKLALLGRMQQIRSEALSPDSGLDGGAMIAAHLNSLPDAERQTLALLERIMQLWPEALPPAGELGRTQIAEFLNSLPGTARQKSALLQRMRQLRPEAPPSVGRRKKTAPRNRDGALREKTSPDADSASSESAARSRIGGPKEKVSRNNDSAPAEGAHDHGPANETRRSAERMPAQTSGAEREEAIARIDLAEGVYVGSAGVVLLHPFLPQLFGALGIAAEGTLVQPERALCLLHFLATGQRRAPEYELLLPKLLCGLPLEEPVDTRIALTTAEEEEAVALLEAVIRHWDALGEASVDGLRGTFLVRPGKLSQRADGDRLLQVEARSFDILLDRLPWGLGTIQLPWMKRILWVEWRL
jgi:hypothetical protein